jgi:conjugative relaxase-like TrwC/TraI family protein
VLTVAKVKAGPAALGYADYLEGRARSAQLGDYYLKDGERVEAPGRWAAGAAAVGADPDRPVGGGVLRALMQVRRPDNGKPLRRAGANGETVVAIDATFSAPKSVSAIWALVDPERREQMERAHEQAVDRALTYAVERVAMIRERVDGEVVRSRAGGLLATSWRHTTARAVDGRPPDPQLHSHVLLHAAVRRDGRIVAIDSRAWLVHRRELGAAYRTELAREMVALGFDVERGTGRGRRYFEIQGVPRELLDRWSSRHEQVREAIDARLHEKRTKLEAVLTEGGKEARVAAARLNALARSNRLASAEDRYLTATTRQGKKRLVTHRDLDRHWSETGRALGLNPRGIEALHTGEGLVDAAGGEDLLDRLTEFDATFTDREARAVALEASAGTGIAQSLARLEQLRESGDLLMLADGRQTTRAHRQAEQHTVSIARRLAAARVAPIPTELVEREAAALDAQLGDKGGGLSAEQRAALRLACADRQLVVIEGQAGTGKSTVLVGVARAHQAAGRQIVVTSTAALAAERLARELAAAGVDASSHSTAALHAALTNEKVSLGPETTVIHEEAALASTREQRQLLHTVQESGARLIEVGDPRQSQAVGAGGLWPHLEQAARTNHAHAELVLNLRAQHPADRRAQQLFRKGEHEYAIRYYAARGYVDITVAQRQAEDHALEAAHHDRQQGMRSLVIAQTSNEHLDELNARTQAIRQQAGELGHHGIPVPGRPYPLHAGDEIQIRHTIRHPQAGQLRNGTTGHVLDINPGLDVVRLELGDGRDVTLDREQLDQADIRLAYVQHPFPAQGQTSDTTHLIIAQHATQEGSYVALTRARHATTIHASHEQLDTENPRDAIPALAEHMSRSEPDVPSIATPLAHEQHLRNQEGQELDAERPIETRDATITADDQHSDRRPVEGHTHQPIDPGAPLDPPRARSWPRSAHERAERLAIDDETAQPLTSRSWRRELEKQTLHIDIADCEERGLGYEP